METADAKVATNPAGDPRDSRNQGNISDRGLFSDVTAATGIRFQYRNGEEANLYTILESLGGGVALLDYDQDGLLDIFLTGGGSLDAKERKLGGLPNRLYHNDGKGRFHDVTAAVGLHQPLFYNHGCAVGDYNHDGWPDLLVTGYGRMALYRNNQGRFTEVTRQAGLNDTAGTHWSTSAAWADLDGDGLLDLFVCQYVDWSLANNVACRPLGPDSPVDVCPPTPFAPLTPQLYLNNGDGTFRAGTVRAGLKPGKALGVLVLDLDEDGRPDIYVANDTTGNQLYHNNGDGTFDEVALYQGVALNEYGRASGSMGVDAADYDGSGRFSLFVTNFTQQAHALYRNRGHGVFQHASSQAGLLTIGLNFVGFGTAFVDYDNDGVEDLIISNGHVLRHPAPPQTVAQRPVLLRNLYRPAKRAGPPRFQDVSQQAGGYFQGTYRGRGLAVGDLDNDGKPDLVISHVNEPVVVLRNTAANDNHWLGIELKGHAQRDITNTRLTLEVDGRRLVRVVKGGGSYLSSSDRRILFGLGASKHVDRLSVHWPSGKTQVWTTNQLGINHYVQIKENNK